MMSSVAFPFPPSHPPICLSIRVADPGRPIISDRRRQLARISLRPHKQVYDATLELSIGKRLDLAESVAWELFTPLHRVLLFALISISSAESRRSRRILQLQRSGDVKDEELKNMQMKLDDLLDQMKFIKNHSPTSGCNFPRKNEQIIFSEKVEKNESIFFHGGSRASHFNSDNGLVLLSHSQSIKAKDVCMNERSKERLIENNYEILTEQEERRMSDLSDFCWSVASSVDSQPAQLSTLAAEQELYNLRNECGEKDATIKELATAAHASNVTYSKRITELEEVIRRKNMIITKLKKDMLVLEQQIVKFARLRRPSYTSSSHSTTHRLPLMTENILYDMSNTSSSSSDCDSPQKGGVNPSCNLTNEILLQSVKHSKRDIAKAMGSSVSTLHQAMSSLKENRLSRKVEANSSVTPTQFASSIPEQKKSRRKNFQEEKMMIAQKKWI